MKIIAIILDFHINLETHYPLYTINHFLIPLGIICFFILITSRSYINSKIKWYMDLKYISPNKLLMYYGAIGTLICLIICIITTFNECSFSYKSFNYSICMVISNGKKYIDNYFIYFIYFIIFKGIEIAEELAIILLGITAFFLTNIFIY